MINPFPTLEEGISLIHEVLKGTGISEELRLKLVAWRYKAEKVIESQSQENAE